jgi:hypothetical protein
MSEPTCIDLRLWCKAHRYRWRFEESYLAEKPENRGDGRWYIEVLCKYGLIYPHGAETLLAYAGRGVKRRIAELAGIEHHQWDDDAEVFRFPAERLDEVAAILKPKRLGGRAEPTEKQREILQRHAFQSTENRQDERKDVSWESAKAEPESAFISGAPFITDVRSY